jgi:hypothetical protein
MRNSIFLAKYYTESAKSRNAGGVLLSSDWWDSIGLFSLTDAIWAYVIVTMMLSEEEQDI